VEVEFSQGRLRLRTKLRADVTMPVSALSFPLELMLDAEPVINTNYEVRLQSLEVKATSSDRRLKIADYVAGTLATISQEIRAGLSDFRYDLKPVLQEASARLSRPLDLPLGGGAQGCADFHVLGVEAGPTIIADGIEKDLALIVAPKILLPCEGVIANRALPPLANVPSAGSGPFTLTVPVAARYEELTKAMAMAFTDGKYFFSTEHPQLYLENPEIYESQGQLVVKLHVAGSVHKFGINANLDGDLFLTGRPVVVDNELRIPDLEPTIETSNFLLSLKAATDGQRIRDEARSALRLDIGERLRSVREKLLSDLTFGTPEACFHGDVDKVEVTGVYPHASYLRVYVAVTGRAAVRMPCATP